MQKFIWSGILINKNAKIVPLETVSMRKFLISVAIVFTLSGTAYAQDYQKGLTAYAFCHHFAEFLRCVVRL